MEEKKKLKKLTINKEIISNLTTANMNLFIGGYGYTSGVGDFCQSEPHCHCLSREILCPTQGGASTCNLMASCPCPVSVELNCQGSHDATICPFCTIAK